MTFADRRDAGRFLAERLPADLYHADPVVLALPRGGVPVGYEVARALRAPLDVFVVRKLGVPGREELAFGAIASGGVLVLNDEIVEWFGITPQEIDAIAAREQRELERREHLYRNGRAMMDVHGRVTVLVDDGLATGASMRAAIRALRLHRPAKIVAAVPIAAPESCAEMRDEADLMVCAATPHEFGGVGAWYRDFSQTTDAEVQALLARAADATASRVGNR